MKLEVGMHVRTAYRNIFEIKNITTTDENGEYYKSKLKENGVIKTTCCGIYNNNFEKVVKASHNIINLVEVGDVVVDNSGRKLEVNLIRVWNDVKEIICNDYNLDDSAITLHNGGIFKVLTHEQFENNCFRIGE